MTKSKVHLISARVLPLNKETIEMNLRLPDHPGSNNGGTVDGVVAIVVAFHSMKSRKHSFLGIWDGVKVSMPLN